MKLQLSIPIIMAASVLLAGTHAYSEIYKWTDDSGRRHFSDTPSAQFKSEQVETKINTYSSVEIKPLEQRLGSSDKVIMYSAAWCGICKQAKRHFQLNNIPYKVYDVEKSRVGKMDFRLLGGRSVPVIIVGTKRMNGFTVSRFNKLYETEIVRKKQAAQSEEGPQQK